MQKTSNSKGRCVMQTRKKLWGGLLVIVVGACIVGLAGADVVALYTFPDTGAIDPSSSDTDTNSTASDIVSYTGGGLFDTSAGNPPDAGLMAGENYNETNIAGAKADGDYITFSVLPINVPAAFSSLSFQFQRNGNESSTDFALYADENMSDGGDNYTTELGSGTFSLTGESTWETNTVNLSGVSFLQNVLTSEVEFRIYLWGGQVAAGSEDYQRIDNVSLQGSVVEAFDELILFEEDFESYTAGQEPGGPWDDESAGSDNIVVSAADSVSGVNCLAFAAPPSVSGFQRVLSMNAGVDVELLVLEYKVKTATETDGWASMVRLYNGGTEFFRTRWKQNNDLLYFKTGGSMDVVKNDNETNNWHAFRAEMDMDAGTADVYWDDTLVNDDVVFLDSATSVPVNNLEFWVGLWEGGSTNYIHYYDDILLKAIIPSAQGTVFTIK